MIELKSVETQKALKFDESQAKVSLIFTVTKTKGRLIGF